MARAEKVAAVAEMTERFQSSAGAGLADYRGLSVAQLGELRRSLGEHATVAGVKNTLTKIPATEAGPGGELTAPLIPPPARAFRHGGDGQGGEAPGGADGQAGAEGEASADDQAG